MLRRVALERNDVSEERFVPIFMVTRVDELGTTLAVASTVLQLLVTANVVPSSVSFLRPDYGGSVFFQNVGSHGVTSYKTAFFVVPAVETSDLT
jgi:hypothetical protein